MAHDDDPLQPYRAKRDFDRTPEPSGGEPLPGGAPRFVIQKHDASRLHYDFRLEVGGVLKSWAVPKGPSTDPAVKRLAIPTEDHPLDYLHFEGTIPKGEYGGGTMLVWDTGTYRNLREISLEQSLEQGRIEIWLEGRKLRGGYLMFRLGRGKEIHWMLVKRKDEEANSPPDPLESQPDSALSGRSLDDIAGQGHSPPDPDPR